MSMSAYDRWVTSAPEPVDRGPCGHCDEPDEEHEQFSEGSEFIDVCPGDTLDEVKELAGSIMRAIETRQCRRPEPHAATPDHHHAG